ncbi:hypothetical protein ACG9Y4_04690 [Acinetobacter guillouiae]|uniref:hypothetical protein n=1 Tax=Acinetobacter guillouiae TaxID=106649 RepID=UPI003AF89761
MSENAAVIPKGTNVQIMGCSYTLLDDVKVDGMQIHLDQTLEAQKNFGEGVGICSGPGASI